MAIVIETNVETESTLGWQDVTIITRKTPKPPKINLLQNKIFNLNLSLSFFINVGIDNTNSIIMLLVDTGADISVIKSRNQISGSSVLRHYI